MLRTLLAAPAGWPHRLMLSLVGLWCLLAFIAAPLFRNTHSPSLTAILVLLGFVGAFCFGSALVSGLTARRDVNARKAPDLAFVFVVTIGLAAAAVILRAIDRILVRGVSLSVGDIASRKLVEGVLAEESPLGLVAAPMMGFCLIPLLLVISYPDRFGTRSRIIAGVLAIFPALEGLLFAGGTSYLAFSLILGYCAYACRAGREGGEAVRARAVRVGAGSLMTFGGLGVAAITLGGMLFKARIEVMTGSVSSWLTFSSSSLYNVLVPSELMISLVEVPIVGDFVFVVYWLILYVTSGVYNLLYVLDYSAITHSWGSTQSYIFGRAYTILAGSGGTDVLAYNPMPGLYQTMFGDVFIDFGRAGGMLQSFVMGVVAAVTHVARMRGSLAAQVLDPIVKAFLIMGIFLSSFTSFGIYVLLTALIALAIGQLRPRRALVQRQAR